MMSPPPGYPPSRPSSPRRDRDRSGRDRLRGAPDRRDDRDRRLGGGLRGRNDSRRPMVSNVNADAKSRLQQWLHIHPGWNAVWLEGIDPPRRMASSPNVTVLMVANFHYQKNGPEEFGFIFTSSRIGAKKKDREKECASELVAALDQLPLEDMRGWCQMPEASKAKREVEYGDLERLTKTVQQRCPKVTIELPEPTAFVLVQAMPWGPGPGERSTHGADSELAILEKFDAGFAELLKEARRVSGLVRKQWFIAVVWAKPEPREDVRPFTIGIGFATDRNLAKARAIYAAEVRAQILTDAMFLKNPGQKPLGDAPQGSRS